MPRRAIEVRADGAAPKWCMSLLENTFTAFLKSPGADADTKAVFAEGSLFSPYLFGKFFDPADAFPMWEFESDVLLAALRRGARTTVDWAENDCEYCLRADIPGGVRRLPPADGRDGRAGRWWEHGFVRRVELPEDADGGRVEAYFDDGAGLLEIKVPKRSSDTHQQA
ncbi:hypothetical protein TRIUR3_09096 [Triticum urartu]|uniref:SHSP domain-containing protein n=1 Tax=Triticum urartu TaxID=4572 RepID=M8B1M0_TRIUA|nr:hypothetical protein TRIUR3_09096 [Triticum urartu]